MMPPRVLASGPKPCGGKKLEKEKTFTFSTEEETFWLSRRRCPWLLKGGITERAGLNIRGTKFDCLTDLVFNSPKFSVFKFQGNCFTLDAILLLG